MRYEEASDTHLESVYAAGSLWLYVRTRRTVPLLFINSLGDVSCPSGQANFCAAVDASDDAWTTASGSYAISNARG